MQSNQRNRSNLVSNFNFSPLWLRVATSSEKMSTSVSIKTRNETKSLFLARKGICFSTENNTCLAKQMSTRSIFPMHQPGRLNGLGYIYILHYIANHVIFHSKVNTLPVAATMHMQIYTLYRLYHTIYIDSDPITLPETNSSPLKIGHPQRKVVSQAPFLRVNVDVSKNGGTPKWMVCNGKPY